MRLHSLAAATAALLIGGASAVPAYAQTDPAGAPAAAAPAAPAATKPARKKKKAAPAGDTAATAAAPADAAPAAAAPAADAKPAKKGKRKKKGAAEATTTPAPAPAPAPAEAPPAPAPAPTVIIKPAAAPAPAPAPVAEAPAEPATLSPPGMVDDDPPTIAHTPITKAPKGKPLVFTARMQDPSGIFQPVLYLRKRGTGDFIPIRMIGSKVSQGDYAVEADAKLISVDLEYYIECYDNVGNGPARAGSPDTPIVIKLEEEKPKVVVKGVPAPVEEKRTPGAPPAISHSTVAKAFRNQSVEIAAKLVGDTGVSNAKVFFRHVGEKEFKELPMGNIGGDDYTASMPPSVVTGDLEYYLEAFDRYGNGPGRSGGPHVPYTITVTEKPADAPPLLEKKSPDTVADRQPPPPPRPRLEKVPFSPNPGRSVAWLFMGGFIGSLAFAGGEAYGAWSANQTYQHAFNYDGRLLPALHQRSVDYTNRAKIFGAVAAGSLVVGITLLLIFPEHPETRLVSGSGGDLVLARF